MAWPHSAQAARWARVVANQAPVYLRANAASVVTETLLRNTQIAVSNQRLDEFHRVRTPNRKLGWMKFTDLQMSAPPTEVVLSATPISRFHLRGLGGLSLFQANNLIETGTAFGPGLNLGGEVIWDLSRNLSLVGRIERIARSLEVSVTATDQQYQFALLSWPFALGLRLTLLEGTFLHLHLTGFLGYSVATQFSGENLSQPQPNVVNVNARGPAALFTADLTWDLGRHFSLALEGGYRYLNTPQLGNSAPLNSGADLFSPTLNMDLSGPVLNVGIDYNF